MRKKNNVHPSIIYGFYLYDNIEFSNQLYPKYNKYLIPSESATRPLRLNVWTAEEPLKELERVQEIISQ